MLIHEFFHIIVIIIQHFPVLITVVFMLRRQAAPQPQTCFFLTCSLQPYLMMNQLTCCVAVYSDISQLPVEQPEKKMLLYAAVPGEIL